jgi:hypothetical protein
LSYLYSNSALGNGFFGSTADNLMLHFADASSGLAAW